jgi:hypothetical protein
MKLALIPGKALSFPQIGYGLQLAALFEEPRIVLEGFGGV